MTALDIDASSEAATVFSGWLERFGSALEARDVARITGCFADDGWWKDILAFTWGYRTFEGHDSISGALEQTLERTQPRAVRLAEGRTPPRLVKRSSRLVIEAYFDFDTEVGQGTGFARLFPDDGDSSRSNAWMVLTTLQELRGHEERVGSRRPSGTDFAMNFAGANWLDQRQRTQEFADRDPEVLIVGAGQAGLSLGARLGQLGVDTLIVEKLPRVGDNWRRRYHSLTLHNEIWANSLPYMPFPPTWPTFVPKDKLAGWLEAYAEAMELNVWTSMELLGADYDQAARMWTAELRSTDGHERAIRAEHLVLATGSVSGVPKVPHLPGIDDFSGEVLHSSSFTSGIDYSGRRAIVVGSGNSGHDVAQDLYSNGARVTMVQRNPTTVVSLVPSGTLVFALYSEGPPVEDVDLITAAIPYPVLRDTYQWLTKRTCALDKDLLDRLEAVGFKTDFGHDGTGFHMKYLRQGGGYYINVGCSDLIANREIGLVQATDIQTFTAKGLRLADDSTIESDLVVLATGYENQQEAVRRLLGDAIAERVGPIWGFDDHFAIRNMWQRTNQPGFWVMGGSLVDCRLNSKMLALQIKADLEGIMPAKPIV